MKSNNNVQAYPIYYVSGNTIKFYCRVKVLQYVLKKDLMISANPSAEIISDKELDMSLKYYIMINNELFDVDKIQSTANDLNYSLSLYYAIDNSSIGVFKSQGTTQYTLSANFPNLMTSLNNSISSMSTLIGSNLLYPFNFTGTLNITLRFFFDNDEAELKDKHLPISQILTTLRGAGYIYTSKLNTTTNKIDITFKKIPTSKIALKLNFNPVIEFDIIGSLQQPIIYHISCASEKKSTWIKINTSLEIVAFEVNNGVNDSRYANFKSKAVYRDSEVLEIETKTLDEYNEAIRDTAPKLRDALGADNIEITMLNTYANNDMYSKYELLLGSSFELYDGNKKYTTTLTSLENNSSTGNFKLVFGTARIKLIDQIKKGLKV